MMKCEFVERFGTDIPGVVYDKLEEIYMAGEDDKDTFVKKVKKENAVVQVQNEVIRELQGTLASLARRAMEALDRMNSFECKRSGEIVNWDVWNMLDTQLGLACDILNIDRYLPAVELKNKLFLKTII